MKIPFDKIYEHTKMNIDLIHYLEDKEKHKKYNKSIEEQFEIMKTLKWEDFENLTTEELERIPIAWLYDWTVVTGNWDYQDKVKELYKKRNLPVLTPSEYIRKFDTSFTVDYNIHKILPNNELKNYICTLLIDNANFIKDVDTCICENYCNFKLADLSIKERIEFFYNTIGNSSRTYILKILTIKYLSQILFNNINLYLSDFWKDRLNKIL